MDEKWCGYPVASSKIVWEQKTDASVSIELLDSKGSVIQQLTNTQYSVGKHELTLNSNGLKPGIYIARILINGRQTHIRLVKTR